MNTINLIIFMSLFWIIFSQLNQLRSSNEGCCADKSCGTTDFDKLLWGVTLTLSIILTLLLVYNLYDMYSNSSMRARIFRANPVKTLAEQGTELMFGK